MERVQARVEWGLVNFVASDQSRSRTGLGSFMTTRVAMIMAGLALLPTVAVAQSVLDMTIVSREADWELRKGADSFTDKVSCVLLYKSNPDVQATSNAMYLGSGRGKGGLAAYKLRYGSEQPQDLQLASKIEKDIGSAIIEGYQFEEAIRTGRIRIVAVGVLSGTGFQQDVATKGLTELLRDWQMNDCPA